MRSSFTEEELLEILSSPLGLKQIEIRRKVMEAARKGCMTLAEVESLIEDDIREVTELFVELYVKEGWDEVVARARLKLDIPDLMRAYMEDFKSMKDNSA